jgi:hypothetical protein
VSVEGIPPARNAARVTMVPDGQATPASSWERAREAAVRQGEAYVVREFVRRQEAVGVSD